MLYSMKNIPIPNNLAGNIFRGNVIEYQILREYMTQHNYTTKRLFNYMIENSIKKGLFRFIISNRIQSNNTENINIVMNEETVIMFKS